MGGEFRGGWEANEEEGRLGEGAVHRQVKAGGGTEKEVVREAKGAASSGAQTWNKV